MSKATISNLKIFLEGLAIGVVAALLGRVATMAVAIALVVFFLITAISLVVLKKNNWKSFFIGVILTEFGFNLAITIHTMYLMLTVR